MEDGSVAYVMLSHQPAYRVQSERHLRNIDAPTAAGLADTCSGAPLVAAGGTLNLFEAHPREVREDVDVVSLP